MTDLAPKSPRPAPNSSSPASERARAVIFWAVAALLVVYVYGTGRMLWPLLTGRVSLGAVPWWSVAAGFYLRFLLMLILVYVLIRFRKHSRP